MLTNIRIDSSSVNKFTLNQRAYELLHSSISSYPRQFQSYITHLKPSITQDKMKRTIFAEYIDEQAFPNYPSAFFSTFCSAPTSGFLDVNRSAFTSNTTIETFKDFYPIAVRWTNSKNLWLIERPPFKASITFKNARSGRSSSKVHTFDVWVPWTSMLLFSDPEKSHYNAWLYFNDGPINSVDDVLVPCFYPNMYNDGRMCLNETSVLLQQHLAETNKFDIKTIYNFIINDYMAGGWNLDLGISIFDLAVARSSSSKLKKIYSDITNQNTYLRNTKKVLSFLKYFSNLSLEEVTSIVTEMKNSFPVPMSNIIKSAENINIDSGQEYYLSQSYYYPDKYSDSPLLLDHQAYPLNYCYALIIESSYALGIDYANFSNRIRYITDPQQNEEMIREFFARSEHFSNRMLDFLCSHNIKQINKSIKDGRSYIDYKSHRENDYILVTEDSIEFITPDMSDDYFISKLTERVSANV